ncbi:Shedu anti-phage system protein SduA domain-containing protein [Knoellia sp. CPCC 206453]|uniref:Shedu anti-phage system protein SduA domain-containing protein n=1 Tax=Knoellia pratensis TaxID=3404796 RepID=UPI003615080C
MYTERDNEPALGGLPKGLGVIYRYGLTFPQAYRPLIGEIEKATKCSALRLGGDSDTIEHDDVLRIRLTDFEAFIRAVDRHRDRASTVFGRLRDAEAHNLVAERVGRAMRPPSPGKLPIIKSMTRVISGETELDEFGRSELIELIAAESRTAITENPEAIGRLRADLDVVTLEVLIEQFEAALVGPSAGKEDTWQHFFSVNTFALQQLFAAPIAHVGEQVQVRVPSLHGTGAQQPDFLLVNTVSRNVHLVEIKTPTTLLIAGPYRGRDSAKVFPPNRELTGAVAQIQAQVQSAIRDLPLILSRTINSPDLDSGVVLGAVIAGSIGNLSNEEKESFMRYRAGLSGVEVITYDEILERLKGLKSLLSGE